MPKIKAIEPLKREYQEIIRQIDALNSRKLALERVILAKNRVIIDKMKAKMTIQKVL